MPVSQSIRVPYTSKVRQGTILGHGIARHYALWRAIDAVWSRLRLESRAAMDLLEYQGKQLFARHGLKVSSGEVVENVDDAVAAAERVGYPVVVKAQVLIGGRGKAGGVKLASDADEVREHAGNILGMDIKGHVVRKLWIEHASDIASEYYASVLLDRSAKQPLVMFSVEGGVDIEEVAEKTPEKLIRHHVDALAGLSRDEAVKIASDGGADSDVIEGVADALVALYEVWLQEDA